LQPFDGRAQVALTPRLRWNGVRHALVVSWQQMTVLI
jgi:hypothetical protein